MAYDYYNIFDFSGGINTTSSLDNLLDNELVVAENIELSQRGGFKRRKGISEYKNLGTSKIDRLVEYEYYDTSSQERVVKMLALTNGDLIDMDTEASLVSGLGSHAVFEVFNDKLYILGNGLYKVYDGETVADVTNGESDSNLDVIKRCNYLVQRGQRLFAAGDPQNPNLLYYSEVGDPTYFKTTSLIKAVTDDGDIITGLKEFHGALLVFKARSIFAWFGYDPLNDVQFQKINVHTGTKAYRTIQYVDDNLFYLGADGVYALIGTYKDVISSVKVSNKIDSLIEQVKHIEPFNENSPCAVYYEGKYMLSVPVEQEGENNIVYVFDNNIFKTKQTECWVVYTGWKISEFLLTLDNTLYSGSSVTGLVHLHDDGYNDLGGAIEVKVVLKPLATEAFVHNKKFRRGYVALRQFTSYSSSFDLTCKVDYKEKTITNISPDESLTWDISNRLWDVSKWDFTELVTRRFDIKEKGKRLTLEIYDNSVDYALEIYGFTIEFKIKKPDRR